MDLGRIPAVRPQTADTVGAGGLSAHVGCNLSSIFHQSNHTNSDAPEWKRYWRRNTIAGGTRESVV